MHFLHTYFLPFQRIFLVVLLTPALMGWQPQASAGQGNPPRHQEDVPDAVCSVPDCRVLFESLPTKPAQEQPAIHLSLVQILTSAPCISTKVEAPVPVLVEPLPSSYLLLNVIASSFL
jgi:hypothetical protein